MKRLRIQSRSGETLVEILVSALLFLMMMAVMQGAVVFCNSAQAKSRQIRDSNAQICQNLREKEGEAGDPNGRKDLTFRAVSSDGQQTGSAVFSVTVDLETKTAADDAGRQATFYLFSCEETGGGSP